MNSFFPSDSRMAEIISAFSLIFASMMMVVSPSTTPHILSSMNDTVFWVVIAAVFGSLQLASCTVMHRDEMTRAILAWITGSFWIWAALGTDTQLVTINGVAGFMLGVSNLYAFGVNILAVGNRWNS